MAQLHDEWEVVKSFSPKTYTPEPQDSEGIPDWIARQLSRSGARALESVGSIPRASYDLLQSAAEYIPQSVKGALSQGLSVVNPAAQFIPHALETVGKFLPSQEVIKETIAQQAPIGYLEPQNSYEQIADDIVSDMVPLLVPIPGIGTTKPLKALGIAGSSNIASYLTKQLGGSEKTQTGVKLGTALLSSLGMGPSIKKKADEFYQIAREAIAPNERIPAQKISDLTTKITREYTTKGLSKAAGKADLDRVVDEIHGFMHDGNIGLADLWEIKKDIRDVGEKIGFHTKAGAQLTQLNNEIDKVLKSSPNKTFSYALKSADELYAGAKRAEHINNFIREKVGNKILTGGALYGLIFHPTNLLKAAGLGVAATSAMRGYDAFKNILYHPAIRNEYGALLAAAAKENAPLTIKHARKLDKKMEKYIPKDSEIKEDEWEVI